MKEVYIHIIIYCITGILLVSTSELKATTLFANDSVWIVEEDHIIQRRDTSHHGEMPKEYRDLKKSSSRFKFTKRLYSLFIREARPPQNLNEKKPAVEEYKPYEGKIIRNIFITVIDPFGTNIDDPEKREESVEFFNNLHSLTRRSTIKNQLQFREGARVRPAIITSSEAQLRSLTYVYDARIMMDSISTATDSVDVRIIVRDKWTIGVDLHSLSTSKVDIELFDKNIFGSGSRAGVNFIYSTKYDRKFGYGGNYLYENVAKTNINLYGSYLDKIRSEQMEFSAIRELQPKLDYFGEASYYRNIIRPEVAQWDSITPDRNETFSLTLGRAFTLSDEDAIRRFVVSLRFKRKVPEYRREEYTGYLEETLRPYKFTKNNMLLMQMSIYQNSYQRQYMVYNFGATEDVAQGYNVSMQLGYTTFEDIGNSMYTSLKASYGTYQLLRGNIYLSTAVSSFFNKKLPFGGVYTFDGRYFTPLFRLWGLRYRQFVSLNYSRLLHPDRYFGDRLYMGEHTTLKIRHWRWGKSGTEQLLFKSETDVFSNYEVAGFRFLFYGFFDMGWINSTGSLFNSDNLNYGMGLGIRLRNNFIVLNTIDLKIGFYPKLNQSGFDSFFKIRSSTPNMPPDFVPGIPEEITLER